MRNQDNPVIDLTQRSAELEQRQWLKHHCDGDQTAFPKLIQLLQQPVYDYLARCGIRPENRDDVFQEIFLKIHTAAASYKPQRPLKPWVFTIAANTVRNYFRKENKRRTVPWNNEFETHADPAPGTEQQAAITETTNWLELAIAKLPLAQREVLVLTTIQSLRLREAASILNMPLNTVKTHLRRARLSLLKAKAGREQEEQF